MLILTRKVGESITIGDDVRVFVLEIRGHQLRIGIEAPRNIAIFCDEILRHIQGSERSKEEPLPSPEAPPGEPPAGELPPRELPPNELLPDELSPDELL